MELNFLYKKSTIKVGFTRASDETEINLRKLHFYLHNTSEVCHTEICSNLLKILFKEISYQ